VSFGLDRLKTDIFIEFGGGRSPWDGIGRDRMRFTVWIHKALGLASSECA
jgi:hypothetical protein